MRRYLAEFAVVFAGVALAFAVENLREDLNERSIGEEYLAGFAQDLSADLRMLDDQISARRTQLEKASVVLEFFEGREVDPQAFFEPFWSAMMMNWMIPNRATMEEVLGSGNLRLVRDPEIRTGLLELEALYARIAGLEAHIARDFESNLYDPAFSMVPIDVAGPWPDTRENRQYARTVLDDLRIENGFRLIALNLGMPDAGLIDQLGEARAAVERLLGLIESN